MDWYNFYLTLIWTNIILLSFIISLISVCRLDPKVSSGKNPEKGVARRFPEIGQGSSNCKCIRKGQKCMTKNFWKVKKYEREKSGPKISWRFPEIGSSKCHCIKMAKLYYFYDLLKQLPVNETEKALVGQLKVLCFKNRVFFAFNLSKYWISKNLLL